MYVLLEFRRAFETVNRDILYKIFGGIELWQSSIKVV